MIDSWLTILLSGVSGTVTSAGVNFIFRDIIAKRIDKSIQHEYDKKLSEIEHNHKLNLSTIENKYEIELTKLKAYTDNDSYKFEKAHLKRVEIVEKVILDIHTLHSEINNFFLGFKFGKDNDNSNSSFEIIKKLNFIIGNIGFAKLYLSEDLIQIIETIVNDMSFCMDNFRNYYKNTPEKKTPDGKDLLDKTRSRIDALVIELTRLSKKIINEKDFEC